MPKAKGSYKAVFAVKEAVDKSGKSIQNIADETGLSYNTILSYYRGSVDGLKLSALGSIAKALDVTPGELFSNEVIANE